MQPTNMPKYTPLISTLIIAAISIIVIRLFQTITCWQCQPDILREFAPIILFIIFYIGTALSTDNTKSPLSKKVLLQAGICLIIYLLYVIIIEYPGIGNIIGYFMTHFH